MLHLSTHSHHPLPGLQSLRGKVRPSLPLAGRLHRQVQLSVRKQHIQLFFSIHRIPQLPDSYSGSDFDGDHRGCDALSASSFLSDWNHPGRRRGSVLFSCFQIVHIPCRTLPQQTHHQWRSQGTLPTDKKPSSLWAMSNSLEAAARANQGRAHPQRRQIINAK